jgi:hypothetical protein
MLPADLESPIHAKQVDNSIDLHPKNGGKPNCTSEQRAEPSQTSSGSDITLLLTTQSQEKAWFVGFGLAKPNSMTHPY